MTGGMDNPVDVVFTPGGERIFTTTFFQHPGGGQRDGLIHAVYGGIYGKDHDVDPRATRGPARTLMPVMTHLGPAAPAGLIALRVGRLRRGVQGQPVRRPVQHAQGDRARPASRTEPTFTTRDSDFLVSDNLDFHPTDVLEDADGSLLVVDTGGWYKLCCPTSQLVKPDVLGAIYRVRRRERHRLDDPRGLKLDWAELADDANSSDLLRRRPSGVRRRASRCWRARARPSCRCRPRSSQPPPSRRRRMSSGPRRASTTGARGPSSARAFGRCATTTSARRRCTRSACGATETAAPDLLDAARRRRPLHNRRVAAEALGRIGDKRRPCRPCWPQRRRTDGPLPGARAHLRPHRDRRPDGHGGRPEERQPARPAAPPWSPSTRWPAASSTSKTVAAEARLRPTPTCERPRGGSSAGIPNWGGDLAATSRSVLAATSCSPAERDELVDYAGPLRRPRRRCRNCSPSGCATRTRPPRRDALHPALARRRDPLKATPDAWAVALTDVLSTDGRRPRRARPSPPSAPCPSPKEPPAKLVAALLRLGGDGEARRTSCVSLALAAVPGGSGRDAGAVRFPRRRLDRSSPSTMRTLAADILHARSSTPAQLVALAAALKTTGPMEVDRAARRLRRRRRTSGRPGPRRGPERSRRCASSLRAETVRAAAGEVRPGGAEGGREAVRRPRRRRAKQKATPRRAARLAEGRRRAPRPGCLQQREGGVLRRATPSATSAARSAPT